MFSSSILALLSLLALSRGELSLLPYPRHVETGRETLEISRCQLVLESDDSLDRGFADLLVVHHDLIFGKSSNDCNRSRKKFPVRVYRLGELREDECSSEYYELSVDTSGIKMAAQCPVGLVRAISTLVQLMKHPQSKEEDVHAPLEGWSKAETPEIVRIEQVPIHIADSPRFGYRGLMIDSSRHFLKVESIKRVIDGMMLAKMNALHWHMSDDDSFPMQSVHIPGLAENSSFSRSMIYTVAEIKDIIHYAKDRGVRVIPEIDSPAHSRAVAGYAPLREIVTCLDAVMPYELKDFFMIHGGPATSALDPTMSLTYSFAEAVLRDMLDYFNDELIHLGGDEVFYECWKERESIEEFMKKHNIATYPDLMIYYITRMRTILRGLNSGKRAVYWSNADTFNIHYADGDVLQYWGDSNGIAKLGKLYPNNKFILSPSNILYLDCAMGNKYGGTMWCGEYKTWLNMYMFEPTNFTISEDRILGAEACMWGEIVSDFNLELRLWPRVAAMAETLWMPRRTSEINLVSLVSRLSEFSKKLNDMGVPSNPVSSQYCESRPKECFAKY